MDGYDFAQVDDDHADDDDDDEEAPWLAGECPGLSSFWGALVWLWFCFGSSEKSMDGDDAMASLSGLEAEEAEL